MSDQDILPLQVAKMMNIPFDGNIIPHQWYSQLKYKNGRVHLPAIVVLAELCYWFRAQVVKDEKTGAVVGYKKRFKYDKLQRAYGSFSTFGLTKQQARDAIDFLKTQKLLTTELRTVILDSDRKFSNELFIEVIARHIEMLNQGIYQAESVQLPPSVTIPVMSAADAIADTNSLPVQVALMMQIAFEGNIIPHHWYSQLKYENGAVNLPAIVVLAELCYWYRPHVVKDEKSGAVVGYKKKFKADMLQRSYASFENFGLTEQQARDAINYLERTGLITTDVRTVTLANNRKLPNQLFIEVVAVFQSFFQLPDQIFV